MLQFGAGRLLEDAPTFAAVFSQVKALNLFALSKLYLETFPEGGIRRDEFANYRVDQIEAGDYLPIRFEELIEDYRFSEEHYDLVNILPYWKTTPRYIDPRRMHRIFQSALEFHVSPSAEVCRFVSPTLPEKYGSVRIWEYLQHYICIDRELKTVQLITSGFD